MATNRPDIADIEWILSHQAEPWLEQIQGKPATPALVKKLRNALSPERTALVLEVGELRDRAAAKFEQAARMFFTRKSLEQATDSVTARFKAQTIADCLGTESTIADLCSGVGGDTLALADTFASVVAVDSNPQMAAYAQANFSAAKFSNAKAVCDDATQFRVEDFSAWHIDPDRRPADKRTSQLEFSTPSAEEIRGLLVRNPNACLKLAPAAELEHEWRQLGTCQWVGDKRSCKQQILWTGDFAESSPADNAAAVLCDGRADVFRARACDDLFVAESIGRYVYEPYPPVLAANLHNALAECNGAESIDPQAAYYTANELRLGPFWAAFEVIAELPFRTKTLRKELAARKIGRLEVKKRGVDISPAKLQRELSSKQPGAATLIVTPVGEKVVALLTKRIAGE